MRGYRCPSCGKLFDPEKDEICPACGAAVAPSVMTRIERKRTAQRMRAEGKYNYDEHCHEDDTWKGSYAAQTHREAVHAHEANLRAGYAAHSAADNRSNASNTRTAARTTRSRKQSKKFRDVIQEKPILLVLLIILIPLGFFLVSRILFGILEWITQLGQSIGNGSFSFNFP